ncbi:PspC domain-containing protein [Modestobacter versicolor]|uniref:PspC domain-containing protein n=1 Tax=Modestobacter versicolor TaxID=429133 RepID=UPI0034DFF0B5
MTSALPPVLPPAPPSAADQPASSWPPPPPPTGPAPRPQLRRSRNDKVIGGVAGGLAEYTGVDALLWRVGAIALTLAGGSGIVIYVLLWLLMPSAPAVQPGAAPVVEREREPRSPVPGVTVAALLILAGLAVLLTQFTDVDLTARSVLGSALLVVGVGLVVAALTGVGRAAKGGLITLGLVLSVALVAASTIDVPEGEVGDRSYRPTTAAGVDREYTHSMGDLDVDLTAVDLTGARTPIVTTIDHGLGDVEVLVPYSADVQVRVDVGIGEVEVFGDSTDRGFFPGVGEAWSGDDDAEFEITIDSGVGSVEVRRG